MRGLRSIALAAAAAALIPATASAAEWSAPEQVAPADSVIGPSLFYLQDGRRLAMWDTGVPDDGHNPGSLNTTAFSVGGPAGWSAGSFPKLFSPAAAHGLARGRAILIGAGYAWNGYDGHYAARVETWSTRSALNGSGSRWQRKVVWKGRLIVAPVAATNARGDAAVIWSGRARGRTGIFVATRRAGRRLGRVRRLGADGSWDPPYLATAINARGDAVFAWERNRAVYARTVSRRDRLGRRVTVGPGDGQQRVIGASIGTGRELSVVWTGDARGGAALLHSRATGGRRFGPPRVLDPCPENCVDPTAATGRDGEQFVVWGARERGQVASRVTALRPEAGEVQELRREPEAQATGTYLVADRSGRAAIVSAHAGDLRVRRLEPGGMFGPPENVPTNGHRIDQLAAATDPATGRISVLYWSGRQPLRAVERR